MPDDQTTPDGAAPDAEPTGPQTATTTAPLVVNTDKPKSSYYRFSDEQGITAGGNLEPLVSIGMTIAVPTMVTVEGKQEIAEVIETIHIEPRDSLGDAVARIVPGTRLIETNSPHVDSVLAQTAQWAQSDAPTKKDIAAEAKAITDAIEEAANRSDEER